LNANHLPSPAEVLDDFSAQQQQQPPQEQQEPTNQSQSQDGGKSEAAPEPDINEEEMLKQLEASMAEFVKASTSAAPGEGVPVDETWSAVADAVGMPPADLMKLLMGEDGAGAAGGEQKQSAAAGGSSSAAPPAGGEDFQETIRKTMERIHESGEKATAAASEGAGDDLLMQVLKAMEGAGGGDGDGDGEDLDKLFLGIMEQLSNKEMLYEPMKELHDKFGPWLKENRDKTPKEDLEKYELQATLVAEIVGRFEEKDFNDENPEHRDYIWQRMQKVRFRPTHWRLGSDAYLMC
jgi:peroxin-19